MHVGGGAFTPEIPHIVTDQKTVFDSGSPINITEDCFSFILF
jgi:hypothetical protein